MSNLGTLGIKPKEKEGNGKKLLIGERAGDFLTKAVSSIPDNRVTRGIGSALDFSELNALTRQGAKAEDWLVNKGAQFAKNRLKIDPRIAALGIGMLIPGAPTNDLKAVKRASKLKKIGSNPLLDIEAKNANKLKLQTKASTGSSGLKPTKLKDGNIEWHVTKTEMPQIKQELENWLRTEYAAKGKAALINRKEFGTIIVDGDPRQISQITQFLEEGGKLPFPPKVVTKKAHAFQRLQNTRPPEEALSTLGKQLGLSQQQINTYIKEAQDGFADVQEAARKQGLTFKQLRQEYITGKKTPRSEYKPGKYHAGHYWPANKGGATTGRTAGIEPGKLNIGKKDSFEGSINLYAAQKAGIPTTWAEDMKMWLRDKKGLPGPRYASDFNNKQRNLIESIPWYATEEQVNAFWKKHKLDEIPNADQFQAIKDELTSKRTTGGLQIGYDRR